MTKTFDFSEFLFIKFQSTKRLGQAKPDKFRLLSHLFQQLTRHLALVILPPLLRLSLRGTFVQKTLDAISRQIQAMSSQVFEVGLFKPEADGSKECAMIPRTWDAEHVLNSIAWMRLQNLNGRNIYIRPAGEHNLTLIDDLKASSLRNMAAGGV